MPRFFVLFWNANIGGGQEKTQAPKITFHEAWPAVGVACADTVVWVDGDKEVATASFAPPKGVNPEDWKYTLINGVTGCLFNTANYDGYSMIWSNDPGTIHDQGFTFRICSRNICHIFVFSQIPRTIDRKSVV